VVDVGAGVHVLAALVAVLVSGEGQRLEELSLGGFRFHA
jgi:hypothetical protein